MENWISVLEFNKKTEDIWKCFLELLNDENIPHKEEIKEKWAGSARQPIYEQDIIVYVPKEYKEKVESYIKEYNDSNNIEYEEVEELKYASDEEEKEYKKRNIAKKILILTPFVMVAIAVICGIVSSIIY